VQRCRTCPNREREQKKMKVNLSRNSKTKVKRNQMSTTKTSINLYWVTTLDHAEDWFIFACTSRSAARYHEDYEGYDPYDAKARLVIAQAQLPKYEHGTPSCHAQIADLIALGFEVVGAGLNQRGVRFKGKLYLEGYLEALVVEGNDKLRKAT
jgi:hypothetical protein